MQTVAAVRLDITSLVGKFGNIALAGMFGICLLLTARHTSAEPTQIDDGWRRTRFGWENIRDWNLPPQLEAGDVPAAPVILSPGADRLLALSHPLAIAGALTILAIGMLHFAAADPLRYDALS